MAARALFWGAGRGEAGQAFKHWTVCNPYGEIHNQLPRHASKPGSDWVSFFSHAAAPGTLASKKPQFRGKLGAILDNLAEFKDHPRLGITLSKDAMSPEFCTKLHTFLKKSQRKWHANPFSAFPNCSATFGANLIQGPSKELQPSTAPPFPINPAFLELKAVMNHHIDLMRFNDLYDQNSKSIWKNSENVHFFVVEFPKRSVEIATFFPPSSSEKISVPTWNEITCALFLGPRKLRLRNPLPDRKDSNCLELNLERGDILYTHGFTRKYVQLEDMVGTDSPDNYAVFIRTFTKFIGTSNHLEFQATKN